MAKEKRESVHHPNSQFGIEDSRPTRSRTGFRLFKIPHEKREGEIFCFQKLAKAFIGADSGKLKMRRLPPTRSSH